MLARGGACVGLRLMAVCLLLGHETAAQVTISCPDNSIYCAAFTFREAETCQCCSGYERYLEGFSFKQWHCRQCPPGNIQPSPSSSPCYTPQPCAAGWKGWPGSCTECSMGSYSPWAGLQECPLCPSQINTYMYQDKTGQSACKECPQFSTSPDGSTAISDCKCNAGYTGSGTCTACVAGKYKASSGSAACDDCVSGKSSPAAATSSSECFDIQANCLATACVIQYGTNSHWQEGPCHCCAGQYQETQQYKVASTRSRCIACDTGFYMDQIKHTTNCKMCADGKQSSEGKTYLLGFSPYLGATACIDCVPGTYNQRSVNGIHTCEPCLPGSYTTTSGQTVCQYCTAGTYSEAGASVCTDCLAGKYSAARAAACTDCTAGKTSATGASVCECMPGKLPGASGMGCEDCVDNESWTGASGDCASYKPGKYNELRCFLDSVNYPKSANACKHCCSTCYEECCSKIREYHPWLYTTSGTIRPDLPDFFHVAPLCPPHTINIQTTQLMMISTTPPPPFQGCDFGQYLDTGGTSCALCPGGKYSYPNTYVGACQSCKAGKYSKTGSSSCIMCPEGTYNSYNEMSGCQTCVAGKYSEAGKTTCSDCIAGKYRRFSEQPCVECIAGKYSAAAATICTNCENGKYSGIGFASCTVVAPTSCVDDTKWIGVYGNCASYGPGGSNDFSINGLHACMDDYVEWVANRQTCTKCCRTCYASCCIQQNQVCPVYPLPEQPSVSETSMALTSIAQTTPVPSTPLLTTSAHTTPAQTANALSSPSPSTTVRAIYERQNCTAGQYRSWDSKTLEITGVLCSQDISGIYSQTTVDSGLGRPRYKQITGTKNIYLVFMSNYKWMIMSGEYDPLQIPVPQHETYHAKAFNTDQAKTPLLIKTMWQEACGGLWQSSSLHVDEYNICRDCEAGKYSEANDKVCTDCPDNSTSARNNSDSSGCVCNVGYAPMRAQGSGTPAMPLQCSACIAGKFKSTRSQAPANLSDSYIDNEKCQDCAAGTYGKFLV